MDNTIDAGLLDSTSEVAVLSQASVRLTGELTPPGGDAGASTLSRSRIR
jgi:hypothetical protein